MANPRHYPEATKSDQVDTYHGIEVKDPFRPLEEKSEARTAWIKAENELTECFLDGVAVKQAIESIAQRLWPYPSLTLPTKRGGRWFASHSDGLRKQSSIVVSRRLNGNAAWRTLVDPNSWSANGTVGISQSMPSPDGKLLLYSFSWGGKDRSEWRLCEVDSRAARPDSPYTTQAPVWHADSKSFFYLQYTEKATVEDGKESKTWTPKLWYHIVGTPMSQDQLVATRETALWSIIQPVADQFVLFRQSAAGGERASGQLLAVETKSRNAEPFTLFGGRSAVYQVVGEVGSTCYLLTDLDAPRYRLIAVDLAEGEAAVAREVIAEQEQVLNKCVLAQDRFVAEYLDGPISRLAILDKSGRLEREVTLPAFGAVGELKAVPDSAIALYSFDSVALPGTIFKVDVRSGRQQEIFRKHPAGFDPTRYVTEQHFATSKDGTKVPMVLVYKKGLVRNGTNPTYMYGYGGFGISVRPRFDKNNAVWLEMGGTYVSVSTRGGGEYGEEWHVAGTKLNKQNVFDDFIAAGEWLIQNGITASDKLAIGGGSNGGLLTGACLVQRPELFAAVVSMMGVHDVLRYHILSKSQAWAPDYGTSDDPDQFKALRAYAPVYNVRMGTVFPAVLITTGVNDDRVDPAHSFKFLAALQEAQAGDSPILGAIEMDSGHGIGTDPVDMQIRHCVQIWTFVAAALGMTADSWETQEEAA